MRDDCRHCQHLVSDLLRSASLFCIQNTKILSFWRTSRGREKLVYFRSPPILTPLVFYFTVEHLANTLTFICLRGLHYRTTLRTVPSDRDVRIRLTGFRVDLGTRYVTVCVVSLSRCRKEWGESALGWGAWSADCGGGGGRETVNRKRKLSAGFLQPIQIPSYMSHVLLLCISFLRVLVVLYLRVTCICVA
jgi:hypothetical protein